MKSDKPREVENLQLFAHALARNLFRSHDALVAVGAGEDDVAIVDCTEIGQLLISGDYLNAKRFSDTYLPRDFRDLGQHCVRQNASDILGSGGIPRWFVLSAIFDSTCTREDVFTFFSSVQSECERLGVTVIGGDTKEGQSVIVHGTILGIGGPQTWTMKTCSAGSDLFVTGELSGVTAALCLLEFSQSQHLRSLAKAALRDADLPLEVVSNLRKLTVPISATDISDGLGYSLNQFTRGGTNIRLNVELERIPLHPLTKIAADALGIPAKLFSFAFGGDFQIVLAAPTSSRGKIESLGAIRIGEVVEGVGTSISWKGKVISHIPDFGHLDFEQQRPVDRFVEFARTFGALLE